MKLRSLYLSLPLLPLLLGVGLPAFASSQTSPAPAGSAYDALQGTWVLVSGARDGLALPADEVRTTVLITQGNTFSLPQSNSIGTAPGGTFTVDTSHVPFTVDSTATSGPQAGQVSLGIYELQGDLQTVDFASPGQPRPLDFISPAGSGDLLQVWRQISTQAIDPGLAIYFGDVVRAFNARDAAAFAATWADDGDLIDPYGVHSEGRQAIQQRMQRMFSSYFATGSAHLAVDAVRLLSNNEALVDVTWTLSAPSGGFPTRSRAFYVLDRQADGSWLAEAARGYRSIGQ